MGWFIIGILIGLIGIIGGIVWICNDEKGCGITSLIVGILIAIIFIFISCLASIPTGHTGVVTTFGKVEDITYEAGIHFKSPFQRVVKMDNRNQKQTIELLCFSSDIQEVSAVYTINYQIEKNNAQTIYKTIGVSYYDTVMQPRIQEAVKSVIANYTAEKLIESRETLSTEILEIIRRDMATYNIEVVSASVEDIDFTDSFTNAVEAKQVAQQNLLKAQTEQQQKTMEQKAISERTVIEAEAKAQMARIQAEADLEVVKIQADAAEYAGQKDAAINKAISESLTPDVLKYYYIKQWNGILPSTYLGTAEGIDMLVDMTK